LAQKNISVCYWYNSNTNLEKNMPFPGIENLSKIIHFEYLIKVYVKNAQTELKKGILKPQETKSE
jgi:hypothetical protein